MSPSDAMLIERWTVHRDADAFEEIVARYSAMVYASCRRVLGNAADAEDVAQECFIELAQSAGRVRQSLGGWLHTVAVRRARDRAKSDARRSRRESATLPREATAVGADWNELQAEIDHINSGNVRLQDTARVGQQLATDLILIPTIERFEYPRSVRNLRMSDRQVTSYSGGGRITLRLINATTGQVVMSDSFDHQLASTGPSTLPRVVNGRNMAAAMMESLSGQIGTTIVTTLFLKYKNYQYFWFDAPLFFYSILVGGYLVSRFLFAGFYRNPAPRTDTPPVTLLIPVFNEEGQIERTIRQSMNLEYPAGKLQVIVIDDGSTDGTPEAIARARAVYPEVDLIRFNPGRGKRHALSAGVRRATGQFIVFIDSDSFLEPDAIHRLLDHFGDPEVAAVTGHCDVENVWTNALTKMQSVRYYVAFRVMKAAESVFDSITCLSGPLACYRRERLLEVLDVWEGQTFLGRPATFGDDRSLTNLLLRRGHKVRYAEKAQCTTVVPEDHRTFLRQQLRWKRSWFRESLIACTFMWKKQPLMVASFYLGFLLPLVAPVVVLRALVLVPMLNAVWPVNYDAGVLVMSAMISSVYLLVKRSRLWLYGVMFCFYYMFILVWQLPIAVLTFAETGWGTRNKAEIGRAHV